VRSVSVAWFKILFEHTPRLVYPKLFDDGSPLDLKMLAVDHTGMRAGP
jgi:hypothetical protein